MATKPKEDTPLAKLREPFKANQISKLPKETRQQIDARKAADGRKVMVFNCPVCGGHHHKDAVHLDYVGHAALTDRLLDTDIEWTWEPLGFDQQGLPALDRNGGLWIKLTVAGVTRLGYGAADGKSGGDAIKEIIGDALRNAAMRFGAALDLWHKGDLHANDDTPEVGTDEPKPRQRKPLDGPITSVSALERQLKQFVHDLNGMGDLAEFIAWGKTKEVKDLLTQCKRDLPQWWDGGPDMPPEFVPLELLIAQKKRDLEQIDEIANASGARYVNAG